MPIMVAASMPNTTVVPSDWRAPAPAPLATASGRPSALVDWNNNYGGDPNKGVVFHCSNLPKDVFDTPKPEMDYQAIIAGTVGALGAFPCALSHGSGAYLTKGTTWVRVPVSVKIVLKGGMPDKAVFARDVSNTCCSRSGRWAAGAACLNGAARSSTR